MAREGLCTLLVQMTKSRITCETQTTGENMAIQRGQCTAPLICLLNLRQYIIISLYFSLGSSTELGISIFAHIAVVPPHHHAQRY